MKRPTVSTQARCSECGAIYRFFRKKHKQHADGHVKDIWCFRCGEVTKHVECSEFEHLETASDTKHSAE